jgi:RsiW-degrading membrane proteinase PrsW (M82 family)
VESHAVESAVYTPVSAAANLRRSAVVSGLLATVAIIVTSIAGHPLMGVFAALGLALGAINNRLLQKSVVAYATASAVTKRKFRSGMMLRLGGITICAIAIALLVRPDGLGIFAGLAVFQILMLVGAAVPVLRSLRPSS